MINLLPQQEKRKLHKEHTLRFILVLLFIVLAVVLMGAAMLAPAYYISIIKENAVKVMGVVPSSQLEEVDLKRVVAETETKLMVLNPDITRNIPAHDLIALISKYRPEGVSIATISFLRKKESPQSLRLQGTALTRAELLAFEEGLESEVLFSNVDLPVSNLADDKDLSFNITVSGEF